MAVDTDILKTLESIEDLLKGASVLTKQKSLPGAKQSQKQRADKEATKAFRAVAEGAKSANETVLGLTKSLNGLNAEIGKTTTGFGSLNVQIARFTASLQPVEAPRPAEQAQTVTAQSDGLFKNLRGEVEATQAELGRLGVSMAAFRAKVDGVDVSNLSNGLSSAATPLASFIGAIAAARTMPNTTQQTANIMGQMGQLGNAAQSNARNVHNMQIPFNLVVGQMINRFNQTTVTVAAIGGVMSQLGDIAKTLIGDFMRLSQVGMGSWTNLGSMYVNALKAGMSLKEYNDLIKENITFAARAGNLENFDKLTSAADKQLAELGVFGIEAKKLQASLANTNSSIGVPMSQMANVIQGQISVFDELRKSTNMTAEEFSALVKEMGKQEQVQKELVGLAPRDRAARDFQLKQILFTGQRLGLAADESKQLADALIKQRGETVKNRFEQAGRIRQLAAFAGMGDQGERAAQIAMKGRRATAEETEELRQILGNIDAASQNIYNTGSFGAQNVIDQLDPTLGSLGEIMKANRPAELAEANKVNQEAFGQHVDRFGQFIGEALKYIRGFNESLLPAAIGAIGSGLLLFFRGPIAKVLTKAVGGVTGATAAGGAAAGGVSSMLAGPVQGLKSMFSTLVSPITSTAKYIGEMGTAFKTTRMAFGTGTAAIGGILDTFAGLWKGGGAIFRGLLGFVRSFGPLAGLIDAAIETVTGEISTALNPEGGFFNRVGGVITAFFSAIPNFIFDTLAFVFGDKALERIRNGFDMFVSLANAAVKSVFSKLIGGAATLLKAVLPDDSKLVKMLDGWSTGLEESADSNFAAFDKLWENNSATLASISKENQKAAEGTAKTADAATQKAATAQSKFNNVQYGNQMSQAQMIADAKAIIGTPQVQTAQRITPAQVNTPETTPPPTEAAKKEAAATATGNSDLLAVLNNILRVLEQSLTEEQKQAALSEALLNRRAPVSFVPAEETANRLLKQRYA